MIKGVIRLALCVALALPFAVLGQSSYGAFRSTNSLSTNTWFAVQDFNVSSNSPLGFRRVNLPTLMGNLLNYVTNLTSYGNAAIHGNLTVGNSVAINQDFSANDGQFTGDLRADTLWVTGGPLRTPAYADVDVAIGGKMDSDAAIGDIVDSVAVWQSRKTVDDLLFRQSPSRSQTNHTGNSYTLDWFGPDTAFLDVNGDFVVSLGSPPSAGTYQNRVLRLSITNSASTNVLGEFGVSASQWRDYRGVTGVTANRSIDVWYEWTAGSNITAWAAGPQDTDLLVADGGTGNELGMSAGAKITRPDATVDADRNVEIDFGAGNGVFILMSTNRQIDRTASRVSSANTNLIRWVEALAMNKEAGTQHLAFNESNFRLGPGITNPTIIAADTLFPFRIFNYGPDASNNVVIAYGGTAAAAAAPVGTDYTDGLIAAWVFTNASGNITDASGAGLTMSPIGGSYTYQASASLEDYAVTNSSDSALCFTNTSSLLHVGGSQSFTVIAKVRAQSSSTTQTAFARYDNGSSDYVFRVRQASSIWQLAYSTNAVVYTYSSAFATSTDTQDVAITYDASTRELNISVDGATPTGLTLNAPLNTETVAFSIGGYLASGAASAGSWLGSIERVLVYNEVKTIGFIQDVNSLRYEEFVP